jgi:hypothetical protein
MLALTHSPLRVFGVFAKDGELAVLGGQAPMLLVMFISTLVP